MSDETPKQTRNVDPDVAMARSRLAVVIRTNGTPEAIAEARNDLEWAKAARLRADADALEQGVRDRMLVTQSGKEGVTHQQHRDLLLFQHEEAQEFKAERGPSREWTNSDRAAWSELLANQSRAHIALGCVLGDCLKGRG